MYFAYKIINYIVYNSNKFRLKKILLNSDIDLYNKFENKYDIINSEIFEYACEYSNETIILDILNNKCKPTKIAYNNLFKNKKINIEIVINYFYNFGYNFTYDDILYALQYKYIIQKEQVKINITPTEEFYDLCNITFFPEYNYENLYNIHWLKMMLKQPEKIKCKDIKYIQNIIIKYNIFINNEIMANINKLPKSNTKENFIKFINNKII